MEEINLSSIQSTVLWATFAVGLAFGAISHRTHFCTMGAIADVFNFGDWNRMRSGFFRSINTTSNVELNESTLIDPSAWKSIGVDALIVGSVKKLPDGRLDLRFNLHDTAQQKSLGKFSYVIAPWLSSWSC